jgi:uncharacterized protein (DUF2235 family)
MARLIVLSDGTGNSAAAVWRTNVWRVYEALDLSRADQTAFYDDGVGTSSFKPLALLGSWFGWGLKRNLIDQYVFLCRNYRAGDEIFLFGFSRGAYTVRLLTALVTGVGLVDAAGKSDAALQQKARAVYRLYRRRRPFLVTHTFVWILRWLRDLFVTGVAEDEIAHRPRIRFLGVWDTVAAYGLPMYEMTRAVDIYFFPLSMRDRSLSASVDRACHALALDDERTTFHPLLWNEDAEQGIFGGPNSRDIARVDQERISQVWFAGMHANVGGGYPDDGMAHVPLDWMVGEAEKCGLVFKRTPVVQVQGPALDPTPFVTTERDELRMAGDPAGRIYNSRAGTAGYYRYGPRKLADLDNDNYNDVFIQLPKIHESAFVRIRTGVADYAPLVLPEVYSVVRSDGTIQHGAFEHSTQSTSRARQQERVWDWVWGRRILYFITLMVGLYVAAAPLFPQINALIFKSRIPWIDALVVHTLGRLPIPAQAIFSFGTALPSWLADIPPIRALHDAFSRVAGVVIPSAIDLASGVLPGFLAPWLDVYKQHPAWTVSWAAIIALLIYLGAWMENRIGAGMRAIWNPIVAAGAVPLNAAAIAPRPSTLIYRLRSSEPYRWFIIIMKQWVLPTFFAAVFVVAGLAALGTFWLALSHAK